MSQFSFRQHKFGLQLIIDITKLDLGLGADLYLGRRRSSARKVRETLPLPIPAKTPCPAHHPFGMVITPRGIAPRGVYPLLGGIRPPSFAPPPRPNLLRSSGCFFFTIFPPTPKLTHCRDIKLRPPVCNPPCFPKCSLPPPICHLHYVHQSCNDNASA